MNKSKLLSFWSLCVFPGAVFEWSHVFGVVFSCWLFAVHLPANIVLPQHGPLELGGPDHHVRSADPPAQNWVWHLQSGMLYFFSKQHLCILVMSSEKKSNIGLFCSLIFCKYCFCCRQRQRVQWTWEHC